MRRRRVGGLEVSVVGLGGNNFGTDFFGARCDQRQVTGIVNAALDAGINLIDDWKLSPNDMMAIDDLVAQESTES